MSTERLPGPNDVELEVRMKAKSLLLGAAATLIAATGAQAADMPLAPVREPVYRCDITGFYEVPGTDVCLRISGYAIAGVQVNKKDTVLFRYDSADADGANDVYSMYATARLRFDARTATEYGTVRGYIEVQADDGDNNTAGPMALRQAFVQVGNWVFGKAWSTYYHGASSPNYTWPNGMVGDYSLRVVQVRYTQPFGNGFSVMVAIEDPGYRGHDTGVTVGTATNLVVVNEFPNLVGAITFSNDRIDAKLSGALVYNERFLAGVGSDDEVGYAIAFGINIALPGLGDGDSLGFKASYIEGGNEYDEFVFRGGRNAAFGCVGVGCVASVDGREAWFVMGWIQHFWRPDLDSTLALAYKEQDLIAAGTVGDVILGTGDVWQVLANLQWTPVNNLSFMVEGTYLQGDLIDLAADGVIGVGDDDTWQFFFQARRDF